MPVVFAVYQQTEALEQTLNTLLRQELLGADFRVITTREIEANPPALRTSTHSITTGVNYAAHIRRAAPPQVEAVLMDQGLSPLEARFIARLVQQGGEVLIWQTVPQDVNLLELLSDYGAVHVLALNQPNFVGV
jgi:hypothetical protein